ncbi:MAG: small ribosomal subunit Rsm22 family protein [Acidobacteriota bacterium]
MIASLPPRLQDVLEEKLTELPGSELKIIARRLSDAYRAHRASGRKRFVRDRPQALAQAALRLPAAHAQLQAVFETAADLAPDFAPTTVLDLGSGPGTALWAARAVWPSLEKAVACEKEPSTRRLAQELADGGGLTDGLSVRWVEDDITQGIPAGRFDLVLLGSVLSELDPADRRRLGIKAWGACAGVLVAVEPGTPPTFRVLEDLRQQLVGMGGSTWAPCPHDDACPLRGDDWCHFVQRHLRPPFQKQAKTASLPYEDATFSHVVVGREPAPQRPWARVLRVPGKAKRRLGFELCTSEGLRHETVPKSRKEAYRLAKTLDWGSAVASPEVLGIDADAETDGDA